MKNLKEFFWFCSGATISLLKKSPTEHNKYAGMGATILFTGMLAGLSGGYALYTVFEDMTTAVVFGIFWGMIIFNLDRLIVSGVKKTNFFADLIKSTPRLALAVLLAIVISQPLELKIFEKEILTELQTAQRDKAIGFKEMAQKEFDEIGKLESANEQLKAEIKKKEEERSQLYQEMIVEAEGKGGSGNAGKGPLYREKKAQMEKIDAELTQLKTANLAEIELNQQKLSSLFTQRDDLLQNNKETVANYDGFLARYEALESLTAKSETLSNAKSFIALLFVMIETAPMLVKLMSAKGPYDDMVSSKEMEISTQEKKSILSYEEEQETAKAAHEMYALARQELANEQINDWKIKEIRKLNWAS